VSAGTVKLYELSEARAILDAWLEESEGELTPEIEALLAELDVSADEKIERVALYIRERKATAAAVEFEADRLKAIQKREERAAKSLTDYLTREMERLGKDKVNGLLCTVAFQKNPPAVQCLLSQEELRRHFIGTITNSPVQQFVVEEPATYRVDAAAVKDAQKHGHPIPPEISITQGKSLRIR
jgi:hypothetical protein